MKILLAAINAKYIHSNLAVYSLRACAGEYQEAVEIAEFTINNQKDYILEQIYKKKPDVLCFSCYIWNLDYVESIAREFHKLCPSIPIWVGGPEVSYEVEDFLQTHPEITGVMIGEGEETFRELCSYYVESEKEAQEIEMQHTCERVDMEIGVDAQSMDTESMCVNIDMKDSNMIRWRDRDDRSGKKELQQIRGIAYRESCNVCKGDDVQRNQIAEKSATASGLRIVRTESRGIMDMSEIPFCYNTMEDFSNRIIYYESSRGCPFSCSYCLSSVDKTLRFRDLALVKKELQFFIDQKVPQIKFVDRTFNCNHKHAMEIWRFVKEQDNGVTNFHFEVSADLLNEEELALIADMRPGLIQLEIGVQSTNEVTIQEIHRTMKLERLQEVVRQIQAGGNIHEHLDLIAGLPYEDYLTFRRSFNEVFAWKPNQLQLGFLKVLKGSYMYEHAKEYGILYHDTPPYEVLSTNWLSYDEVLRIKQVEEMLEVYYNSGQFEITMKILEKLFENAFDMFQELGEFYECKGYFGMSHSRIRRCEILLEFLEERMSGQGLTLGRQNFSVIHQLEGDNNKSTSDAIVKLQVWSPETMGLVREALIFDLYYRENCKSRPKWAIDPATFKQMTRTYCANGKLSHIEPFHYVFPDKSERTIAALPERTAETVWVLFHYDRRDPLDHQAEVEYIKEP